LDPNDLRVIAPSKPPRFKSDFMSARLSRLATDWTDRPSVRLTSVPILAMQTFCPETKAPYRLVQTSSNDAPPNGDPELGNLRLQIPQERLPPNNFTGQPGLSAPLACPNPDPELGCIRLQQPTPQLPQPLPAPAPRYPVVYLTGHLDYFQSSNIFSATNPVSDGMLRPGLTLTAVPALGPNTFLIAGIDANWVRYSKEKELDYNELWFRASIFQSLSPKMFGEIGWSNQQLFINNDKIPRLSAGSRFLNEHALRFNLSRRDQLLPQLSLNTSYQFNLAFSEPRSRSRVVNALVTSLSYDVQQPLQIGLDYQLALANFTQRQREDIYHQINARLTYTVFHNTQLNLFAGYSFGSSTEAKVNFNGLILGVSLGVTLGLF